MREDTASSEYRQALSLTLQEQWDSAHDLCDHNIKELRRFTALVGDLGNRKVIYKVLWIGFFLILQICEGFDARLKQLENPN